MATLYSMVQTDAASACGTVQGCSASSLTTTPRGRECSRGASAGSVAASVTVPVGTRSAVMFESKAGEICRTTWASGNWTIRLNVTTSNANLSVVGVSICRFTSGCSNSGSVASSSLSTSLSTTGVKSWTVTQSSDSVGNEDDRVYVVLNVRNTSGSSQSFSFTPNQTIDTPIDLDRTLSVDGTPIVASVPDAFSGFLLCSPASVPLMIPSQGFSPGDVAAWTWTTPASVTVPSVSVTPGTRTSLADPSSVSVAVPDVSVSFGNAPIPCDPSLVTMSAPDASVTFGASSTAPSPSSIHVVAPDITVALDDVLSVDVSSFGVSAPDVSVSFGELSLAIAPTAMVSSVPTVTKGSLVAAEPFPDLSVSLRVPSVDVIKDYEIKVDVIQVPISVPFAGSNKASLEKDVRDVSVSVGVPSVSVGFGVKSCAILPRLIRTLIPDVTVDYYTEDRPVISGWVEITPEVDGHFLCTEDAMDAHCIATEVADLHGVS